MQITRNQFELTFRFEKKEWQVRNGKACKDFLAELKDLVPLDFRDFDSSTNTWLIKGEFMSAVDELKRKYFTDPNQAELFG